MPAADKKSVRVSLRHALLAALVLLPACSSATGAEVLPPRASPIDVPTWSPSASAEIEDTPAPAVIDQASGETLAMTAAAAMTVSVAGRSTTEQLAQSTQADTVIEQNEGETKRVLRLFAAAAGRPDDVQFSVEGIAAPGTYKTGEAKLTVVLYNSPLGIDLLSDSGDCTVVLETADASGASGTVTCHEVATDAGKAEVAAKFTAKPINK